MNRRRFIEGTLSGGVLFGAGSATSVQTQMRENAQQAEVVIERDQTGQPHKGKVLAAIQPHCDDLPLFASGTILKLIRRSRSIWPTSRKALPERTARRCEKDWRNRN